jgi:hypothetical protein
MRGRKYPSQTSLSIFIGLVPHMFSMRIKQDFLFKKKKTISLSHTDTTWILLVSLFLLGLTEQIVITRQIKNETSACLF